MQDNYNPEPYKVSARHTQDAISKEDFRRSYNDNDFVNQAFAQFASQENYLTVEEFEYAAETFLPYQAIRNAFNGLAQGMEYRDLPVVGETQFSLGMRQLFTQKGIFLTDSDERNLTSVFERFSNEPKGQTRENPVMTFRDFFSLLKDVNPLSAKINEAVGLKRPVSSNNALLRLFGDECAPEPQRLDPQDVNEKPVSMWTPDDVTGYWDTQTRQQLKMLREYAVIFSEQNIDGEQLLTMDDERLDEIGVQNQQHRHLMLSQIQNLRDQRVTLTLKIETASLHKRPICIEVYDTDKVSVMREKFLKQAALLEFEVPDAFVFMAFGRVLENELTLNSITAKDPADPRGVRDLRIDDNTSVFLISDAMQDWTKEQVYLWVRAHPTFSEYAQSFYRKNIDGPKLIDYVIEQRSSDFMGEFTNGQGKRIPVGHKKDLMTAISFAIDDWRTAAQKDQVPGFSSQSRRGKKESKKPMLLLCALLALAAVWLGNKGGDAGGVAVAPSGDSTMQFTKLGHGQCMLAGDYDRPKRPRYYFLGGVSLTECEQACFNTGVCTAIAHEMPTVPSSSERCVVYVSEDVAPGDDWKGPFGDAFSRPDYADNSQDGFICYLLEDASLSAAERQHIDTLNQAEASIKGETRPRMEDQVEADVNNAADARFSRVEAAKVAPGAAAAAAAPAEPEDVAGTTIRMHMNMNFPKGQAEVEDFKSKLLEEVAREMGTDPEKISILGLEKGN